MSVNSADNRSQSSWKVRDIGDAKRPTQASSMMLLGRRLEVFRPKQGAWINGLVVKEIKKRRGDMDDDEDIDEDRENTSELESKWLVKLDNNESLYFDSLRGNSLVRFLGTTSVINHKQVKAEEPDSPKEISMLYSTYGRRKGMGPRYLEQTESASQPSQYTNFETERIQETFRSGNYHSMKKLPVAIVPGEVLATTTKIIETNLKQSGNPTPSHRSLKRFGLFHNFGHISSPHDMPERLRTQERKASEWKRATISGGSDRDGNPFSAPFVSGSISASTHMKHEGNFPGSDDGCFPYMPHDADEASDILKQDKAKRESLNIHRKSFVQTGARFGGQSGATGGGLSARPTRKLLPELLKEIHARLVEDWPKSNFSVSADADDIVFIKFESSTVDSIGALKEYMNTTTIDNSSILATSHWYKKYHVRKIVESWGAKDEPGYISFALRPPWCVKSTSSSSYQSLHPDTASFGSSRGANSHRSRNKSFVTTDTSQLSRKSSNRSSTSGMKRSDSLADDISALGI